MNDVTHYFSEYRECVRHLWNTHYYSKAGLKQDWDAQEDFEEIADLLFRSLVLTPLSLEPVVRGEPIRALVLVPVSEHGVPILINREKRRSGYWDHPVNQVRPIDAELNFMGFFDFDVLGFRDFRYFEAIIHKSNSYPDIVGRVALADCDNWKVCLVDSKARRNKR